MPMLEGSAPISNADTILPDTKVAAEIIGQAAHVIAAINRYRLALVAPDASQE